MATHRIRSAGILLVHNAVLLVKIKDETGVYWIPPGGGFEEGDISTKGCLKREFKEEAGIDVIVGDLICVREFLETTADRYNAEFFYHIIDFSGIPNTENLKGLNDEDIIQGVEWVPVEKLFSIRTYPSDISEMVKAIKQKHYSLHLGSYIQGNDETTDYL
ncbi:NUDIX domain-containing protein [Vibrio sp.]|nr:NUDIX domain-containing protein [Vibrio sp.]